MPDMYKQLTGMHRNLAALLKVATKLVSDTKVNLRRLKELDAECSRLASVNRELVAENQRLKKGLVEKFVKSQDVFQGRMDSRLFRVLSPVAAQAPHGHYAVVEILPVRERLDVYQKKTLTRLENALNDAGIHSVSKLQEIGGLAYFESMRNVGVKALQMLSASMLHHGVKWGA